MSIRRATAALLVLALTAACANRARADTIPIAGYSFPSGFEPIGIYPDVAGHTLSDGFLPAAWPGSGDAVWVGWSARDAETVFDLGTAQSVGSVQIWEDRGNLSPEIYLPTLVQIDFSSDGSTFSGLQSFTVAPDAIPDASSGAINYALASTDARYVRIFEQNVIAQDHIGSVAWIFNGEVSFTSGAPAPEPTSLALATSGALALGALRSRRRPR